MTASELCKLIGATSVQLKRWVAAGLPRHREGRRWVFDVEEVEAWLVAEGLARPADAAASSPIVRSRAEVAAWFARSASTVDNWATRCPHLQAGTPGIAGRYDCQKIAQWLAAERSAVGETTDALLRRQGAEAELMEARRDKLRLELARERGEIVDVEVVHVFLAQELQRFAAGLEKIADEVSLHVDDEHREDVRRAVERTVERHLEALAECDPVRAIARHNDESEETPEASKGAAV